MKKYLIPAVILFLLLGINGCSPESGNDETTVPQTPVIEEEPAQEEEQPDTSDTETPSDEESLTVEESTTSEEDSSESSSPKVETEPEELPSGYIVDKELCSEDSQIEIYHITYMSDGLKVKGYLAQPKAAGTYPAVIFNRGGNLEFGKLSCSTLTVYASNGFVAIGSQYRGNDGGEGREEFGGEDINDVMNLIPVLQSLPNVDADKIGMVGYSRGGMMTYLALKEQTLRDMDDIKAACTVGGTADLFINAENRDDMLNGVFVPLIGGTPDQLPEEFEARSATYWADKINTPLLIQHGEADWRVLVDESRKLAEELEECGKDYELITYPGDDHGLSRHNSGLYEIFSYLSEHLDVQMNLSNIARETPYSSIETRPGEIENGYFYCDAKGYRVAVPSGDWTAKIPSSPLDVMFSKSWGYGWAGTGGFSSSAYTTSYFNNINSTWVADITSKWGYTDVQVVDKGDTEIDGHIAKYVTFEYTTNDKRYIETTYHIWQPEGEYRIYRIRENCLKDDLGEFQDIFDNLVSSFKFL